MAENGESNERSEFFKLIRKAAEERDPKYADMTDRAAFIVELFQREHPELSSWDITCFAASWLALQANEWIWLRDAALKLAVSVAQAHYMMDEAGLTSVVPADYIDQIRGPRIVKDDASGEEPAPK